MQFHRRQLRFCYHIGIAITIVLAVCCMTAGMAQAQDVIHLRRTSGDGATNRKGEIVDWIGNTISIRGSTGLKEIDTDRLIRIETAWDPNFTAGENMLAQYQYLAAINLFESALDGEERSWMQNIVHAKLLECFLATENFGRAANQFLNIVNDDPQSRFRHLIPLVWTSSRPDKTQTRRAQAWLDASEPTIQLLGASWLLTDSDNAKAIETLEKLTRDFDPMIKSLAAAQLWRQDRVALDAKRMELRIAEVRRMPEEFRSGAWYLVAQGQSKLKQHDDAIANFMRIPINDPQQGGLAAAGLYQAAWILQKTNRTTEAQTLRDELKEKFGDTVWAN